MKNSTPLKVARNIFRNLKASVLVSILSVACAYAAPADLDLSFNGTGKVMTLLGTPGTTDTATSMAMQADGKIVLAGNCQGVLNTDFCALRYNADGTLDTTFRNIGSVITAVSSGTDTVVGVGTQLDGKIVLAGNCGELICLVRYNVDGSLDTNFNGTGKVMTPGIAQFERAYTMAVQPDGTIIVGSSCLNDFCVRRFTANGALDTSFNSTGISSINAGPGPNTPAGVAFQSDGKVVIAGYCYSGFCAARFNSDGSADTAFHGNGTAYVVMPIESGKATGLAISPNEKIVIGGYCGFSYTRFCALRLNADGSTDLTFNATGFMVTQIVTSGAIFATSVNIQSDGKIVLAGSCDSGANYDFCIVRYNTDGSLDKTFSGTGWTLQTIGPTTDWGNTAIIQPDGKILIAGACQSGFCAARFIGGPTDYQTCKPDIDGDGRFLATTDALIYTRIALGFVGESVVSGITFSQLATRTTWQDIRRYLATQCGLSLPQ